MKIRERAKDPAGAPRPDLGLNLGRASREVPGTTQELLGDVVTTSSWSSPVRTRGAAVLEAGARPRIDYSGRSSSTARGVYHGMVSSKPAYGVEFLRMMRLFIFGPRCPSGGANRGRRPPDRYRSPAAEKYGRGLGFLGHFEHVWMNASITHLPTSLAGNLCRGPKAAASQVSADTIIY